MKAPVVARRSVVSCNAIAAAERPTKVPGPVIMNGQILHSITKERLELVKTLGPYLETQVRCFERTLMYWQRRWTGTHVALWYRDAGAAAAEGAEQVLAAVRFPARIQRPRLPGPGDLFGCRGMDTTVVKESFALQCY